MTTTANCADTLRAAIRDVPDFPKPGILFRDLTPVLADARLSRLALDAQLEAVADLRDQVDLVLGIEARGFLFGPVIAQELGVGFVPVRKPGKLPAQVRAQSYGLEYGDDTLEMHVDAVQEGQRVLIVDDLLATGGTASAVCALAKAGGAKVLACVFLVELKALGGRAKLGSVRCESVVGYD